jgi:hypothetical protein
MAARPATIVSAKIAREALRTSEYLGRILAARAAGNLRDRDVEQAFQGAYLEFYVLLEEQLEYLFYGLLMGRLLIRGTKPKVTVKSEITAKQLVLGGRPYADWLPLHHTIGRAEVFFHAGAPFGRWDGGHRSTFSEMKFIRDAIAHSGSHAAARFRHNVIQSRPIPVRERRPGSYLAGVHSGQQTRLDEVVARASRAFAILCA